jgi:thymidylate synthase (FAD)
MTETLQTVEKEESHRSWWSVNTDVLYGTCWCGCGLATKLADKTRPERDQYAGLPMRYLHGHGGQRVEPVDGMLTCRRCNENKTIDNFYENGHRKNIPHARKYQTICKICILEQTRERKYNLSTEEYEQMYADQNGRCATCNEELDLVVDHDHETDQVRGLLCSDCNIGLGFFKDRPEVLKKAARYLNLAPIKVLNKGYVELVDSMADDLFVVNSARVSFNTSKQSLEPGDEKLIQFLMKNRHGTPFESSVFTFRVKAPIFVFREWQRHRIGSFNEWSARYSELKPDFYIPESENVRRQVPGSKPGQYVYESASIENQEDFVLALEQESLRSYDYYQYWLGYVAKEQARMFLPVNIFSEMYWTVNARSLMNFLSLRNSDQAQKEIQIYASVIEDIFIEKMPITAEAFVANDRKAP